MASPTHKTNKTRWDKVCRRRWFTPPPLPLPLVSKMETAVTAAGIRDRQRIAMETITSEVFYLNHVERLEELQEQLYEESILLVEHNKRIFSNVRFFHSTRFPIVYAILYTAQISEIGRITYGFLQDLQKLTRLCGCNIWRC